MQWAYLVGRKKWHMLHRSRLIRERRRVVCSPRPGRGSLRSRGQKWVPSQRKPPELQTWWLRGQETPSQSLRKWLKIAKSFFDENWLLKIFFKYMCLPVRNPELPTASTDLTTIEIPMKSFPLGILSRTPNSTEQVPVVKIPRLKTRLVPSFLKFLPSIGLPRQKGVLNTYSSDDFICLKSHEKCMY